VSQRLQATAQKFYLQSDRILTTFKSTLHPYSGGCCRNTHEPTRRQCVLDLYDSWSQFCRDLILMSARGGYATSSGVILTRASAVGSGNPINSIYSLSRRYGPTTPPSWGIPSELVGIARRIGISNYANMSAAIGSVGSPSEKVRATRNYIAHKSALTAQKAIAALNSYGVTPPFDVDALLVLPTNHGVVVFEDWRNGLVIVAFSSCS